MALKRTAELKAQAACAGKRGRVLEDAKEAHEFANSDAEDNEDFSKAGALEDALGKIMEEGFSDESGDEASSEVAGPASLRHQHRVMDSMQVKSVEVPSTPSTCAPSSPCPSEASCTPASPSEAPRRLSLPAAPRATTDCDKSSTKPSAAPAAAIPASVAIVGRDAERQAIKVFLSRCLSERGSKAKCAKQSRSMYVSGGPGTGKTSCTRAVVAELLRQRPGIRHLEVNCMRLAQKTPAGLFAGFAELCGGARAAREVKGRTGHNLQAAAVQQIAKLGRPAEPVILVVDEVDQLVPRKVPGAKKVTYSGSGKGGCALEALFSLPHVPGAPPMAVVAIANAVDLLQRPCTPVARGLSETLLFEPYTANELRDIFKHRLDGSTAGIAAQQALGKMGMELRVRQVAKQSGDCRRLLNLCDEAILRVAAEDVEAEDSAEVVEPSRTSASPTFTAEPAASSSTPSRARSQTPPPRRPLTREDSDPKVTPMRITRAPTTLKSLNTAPKAQNDPLKSISQLPIEQQVLLCALANSDAEAVKISDICASYKELCRRLHQPLNLATKGHIGDALSALGERGLLELRSVKGRRAQNMDKVVELAVSRGALREGISRANPGLERCLHV